MSNLSSQTVLNSAYSSKSKRFLNYFIDSFICNSLSIALAISNVLPLNISWNEDFNWKYYLIFYFVILFYYITSESVIKGKTLAKFLTKTTAMRADGVEFAFRDALVRSLCRLIPFDALSFLGELGAGWHDSIAKTVVVDDKLYEESLKSSSIDMIGETTD